MNKPNKRELIKIGRWLMAGDTGQSSLTMCSFYLTVGNCGEYTARFYTPLDPSDFARCVKFLDECVDKSNQYGLIYELGRRDEKWKRIKDDWFVLIGIYDEEKNQDRSPRLYAFMQKIGL